MLPVIVYFLLVGSQIWGVIWLQVQHGPSQAERVQENGAIHGVPH